jgi:acetyl esterase/lipase
MTMAIYPLAPEHTWSEAMAFNESLYLDMAREHGAENIIVTGDSAGGGMSLLLAQSLRDQGKPQPAALALFSPVLDLSASGEDQPALEHRDPTVTISLKCWNPTPAGLRRSTPRLITAHTPRWPMSSQSAAPEKASTHSRKPRHSSPTTGLLATIPAHRPPHSRIPILRNMPVNYTQAVDRSRPCAYHRG